MVDFLCDLVACTPNPYEVMYRAMHQDYSRKFVGNKPYKLKDGKTEPDIIIQKLLANGRGHWGVLEHVHFVFSLGYIPHSVVVQLRTHRLFSFDVQSFRYTSFRVKPNMSRESLEEMVYVRPVGKYKDRIGRTLDYTSEMRERDLVKRYNALINYKQEVEELGYPFEMAKNSLPEGYRQHFVMSGNLRAFLGLFDTRLKQNAQLECRQTVGLMKDLIEKELPEIIQWYDSNRLGKALLAP